jgi:hypothetical protein
MKTFKQCSATHTPLMLLYTSCGQAARHDNDNHTAEEGEECEGEREQHQHQQYTDTVQYLKKHPPDASLR